MTPHDLIARRTKLGLTRAELARQLGVPDSTIHRWELGRVRIERPETIALALEALETRAATRTA